MDHQSELKLELVAEFNDLLDSLSPETSKKITNTLSSRELLELNRAICDYARRTA
jgi:hypothetical protein